MAARNRNFANKHANRAKDEEKRKNSYNHADGDNRQYSDVNNAGFLLSRLRNDEEELVFRINTVRSRIKDCDSRISESEERRSSRGKHQPYGLLLAAAMLFIIGVSALLGLHLLMAVPCLLVAVILWLRAVSEYRYIRKTISYDDNAIVRVQKSREQASEELEHLRQELAKVRRLIQQLQGECTT